MNRVVDECTFDRGDRLEGLPRHFDCVKCLPGELLTVGDHESHGFALVAGNVLNEDRLVMDDVSEQTTGDYVCVGEDSVYPGHCQCFRRVYGHESGMGMWTPLGCPEQHAGHSHVVAVLKLAGDLRRYIGPYASAERRDGRSMNRHPLPSRRR